MQKLILLRGLPGAGKTTVRKELFSNFLNYEANTYFINSDGVYCYNADKLKQAHDWCFRKTEDALRSGHDVIVTNTFMTYRELKPYLKLAEDVGAWVTVMTVNNHHGSKSTHDVPEEKMEFMKSRYFFF